MEKMCQGKHTANMLADYCRTSVRYNPCDTKESAKNSKIITF